MSVLSDKSESLLGETTRRNRHIYFYKGRWIFLIYQIFFKKKKIKIIKFAESDTSDFPSTRIRIRGSNPLHPSFVSVVTRCRLPTYCDVQLVTSYHQQLVSRFSFNLLVLLIRVFWVKIGLNG
jgi:hypothetical protein